MKARARPEALGISFVESFSQPKEVDELYEDDGEDVSEDPDPPQELERRRPSLVIAGDASALESVRTVHSPKAARVLGNLSPRGFARSPAKPLPPASPRGGAAPPSPIRTLIEDDEPVAAEDSIGWRAAWTAKLSSARGQIDLVGTLLLLVYCYHDCLNEPNECHEDCLADPNSCLLLPAIIASAAVGLFVLYGYAQPAAMFEWAQTTMAASCIQRIAPLGTIALVASNEENLALVSDGTAAAFAGFLVCRARLPWPLVFLALTMASSAIDGIVRSSSAVEAGSVVLGLAIVWSAHFVVATLRRLTKLDGAVPSLAISAKKCV